MKRKAWGQTRKSSQEGQEKCNTRHSTPMSGYSKGLSVIVAPELILGEGASVEVPDEASHSCFSQLDCFHNTQILAYTAVSYQSRPWTQVAKHLGEGRKGLRGGLQTKEVINWSDHLDSVGTFKALTVLQSPLSERVNNNVELLGDHRFVSPVMRGRIYCE